MLIHANSVVYCSNSSILIQYVITFTYDDQFKKLLYWHYHLWNNELDKSVNTVYINTKIKYAKIIQLLNFFLSQISISRKWSAYITVFIKTDWLYIIIIIIL